MLEQILSAFPDIDDKGCLESYTEAVLYIRDTESGRCICHINPDDIVHVTVRNEASKLIHFLAIDGCLLSNSDEERCDCLLFTDSLCCFIEIKIVDFKSGNAARRKAKSQLQTSINYFRRFIDISNSKIRAYVCVGKIEPRPSISATDINERVRFATMNVELFHGNTIEL